MSEPLLLTKLYIPPPRSKIVLRPGLITRLNEGLAAGRKLTLISAPAGFGKTTLVSEWIADCGSPVGWVSLDEGDTNPARFLSYLVTAFQLIKTGIGERLLVALQSREPPPIEAVLTDLINEITSIPDHFIIVLDDYHSVESKQVDQAVNFLIEHQPPQMHLLITSREDPTLPLARLRARGQLTELRATDLRFSPAEAADFLNQVMGLSLSYEEVAALETRTEGWIAGLQMAALSMRGLLETGDFIRSFTGSHRFVLDYLMEEVLERQREEVQTFLLRTSILDRLCGPLCDALFSDSSAYGQQTLEHLEHANLFIVSLDSDRCWYRYHHLFGDLLRKRLEQKLTSEGIAGLHIQASEWFEKNGLVLDAFKHAAAANDIERAERLMELKEMPLHLPGVPLIILKWLESLPLSVLNSKPALWWKQAAMLMASYQTIGVEEKLQATEAALATKTQPNGEMDEWTRNLFGKIAFARAALAATGYQAETTLVYANRAMEFLHPKSTAYRSEVTQYIGFARYLLGERDAAEVAYKEALSLAQSIRDNEGVMMATIRLGQIHELRNQLHEAFETYQKVVRMTEADPPPFATLAYIGLARIYYNWNDLYKAEKYAEQSHQLARLCEQVIDRLISCELFYSRLKITQKDPVSADCFLTQAEQHARQYGYTVRFPDIAAARAKLCLYNGDTDAAAQHVQNEDRWLVRAEVLIAQGNPSAALAIIVPHRQRMEERKLADQLLVTIVLQALALHALDEKDQTRQVLKESLTLAEPGGFIRLFVDAGKPMRLMLQDLKSWIDRHPEEQDQWLMAYLEKILAAFASPTEIQASKLMSQQSGLIEPLSQRELEVLKLICQGQSNNDICKQLYLALDTVKGHNRRIFEKLQVHRRTEAIARARELNLI
ncbi:MAG: LuxR C-terminal-related transcriptional regulator [Anaerolineaceae bacterium]